MLRFNVLKNEQTNEWWAQVVSRNGKIVFTTETYKRKQGAINALDALRHHFRTVGSHSTMTINVWDGDEWVKVLA